MFMLYNYKIHGYKRNFLLVSKINILCSYLKYLSELLNFFFFFFRYRAQNLLFFLFPEKIIKTQEKQKKTTNIDPEGLFLLFKLTLEFSYIRLITHIPKIRLHRVTKQKLNVLGKCSKWYSDESIIFFPVF